MNLRQSSKETDDEQNWQGKSKQKARDRALGNDRRKLRAEAAACEVDLGLQLIYRFGQFRTALLKPSGHFNFSYALAFITTTLACLGHCGSEGSSG